MELDLHCHTSASFDCRMRPAKVLARARAVGLGGIAITDHDTLEGAREAAAIAGGGGDLLVIVGEEISTTSGEIIGLFLKEHVATDDPIEAIREIHGQGGVALLPHPFTRSLSIEERVAQELDACEGFNARHAKMRRVDGTRGEEEIVAFAARYGLTTVASSDAHFPWEIGRARTVIPASGAAEVKKALLEGNTVLTGRRSSAVNRLLSTLLKVGRRLAHPEPAEE
ncbi:MAG: PHP-associated domain-containing protein [Planctomycetota bacterium]|jgi:predicted metal-dependent phosphoesterase TrpH